MKNSLIDTVKFEVKVDHVRFLAEQRMLHTHGIVTPITQACVRPGHNKKFRIDGAYGSHATVWSKKGGTALLIECSAAKFRAGHNLFGSDEPKGIAYAITETVCDFLGFQPCSAELTAIGRGAFRLFRVDLAAHIKLPKHLHTSSFIDAMKFQIAFTKKSFSVFFDETLYVNQGSDMNTLKIYDKYKEIFAHPLPAGLPDKKGIELYAKNLVRVEMTFRNRLLARSGMSQGSNFDIKLARKMMRAEIKALGLTDQSLLQCNANNSLGNLQRCLVALHGCGVDLKTAVDKRQLKIHMKTILNQTGIDLKIPYKAFSLSSIPVKKYMEGMRFLKEVKSLPENY